MGGHSGGERLVMDVPFGSWGAQTFFAGLGADTLIAPWVIKGAMDREAFTAYIEQVLIPELGAGSVVISHKNPSASKAMREAGC